MALTDTLDHYRIWIEMAGGLSALVSVLLILWQIRSDHQLNRKKTSQEILGSLVMGEFVKLIDEIVEQFHWDVIQSKRRYQDVVAEISATMADAQVMLLDAKLRKILRFLEAACISMHHGIVDEEMCRDYLFSILIRLEENCSAFVAAERRLRGERRVFEHFERYALCWRHERDLGKEAGRGRPRLNRSEPRTVAIDLGSTLAAG